MHFTEANAVKKIPPFLHWLFPVLGQKVRLD